MCYTFGQFLSSFVELFSNFIKQNLFKKCLTHFQNVIILADLDAQNPDYMSGRHSLTQYNDFATIHDYLVSVANANSNAVYKEFGISGEGRAMMALEIGTGTD